jgi:hypothetical protein
MKILPNGIAVIEGDTHISKWVEQSGSLDHDQNTLPLPGSLMTPMVPPISSARLLQMANPNPVPLPVRALSPL